LAARFLSPTGSTDTRTLLEAMTLGIRNEFIYVRRPEKGVQRPKTRCGSTPAAAAISPCS